jgi:putative transposase
LVPIKKKVCSHVIEPKIVALDPGVRTFQTCFSKDTIIECHINQDKYNKLKNKISLLQKNRKNKNIKKLYKKIKNMVSDLHWRTITFLRKNFTDVLIPTFESKKMMSGTSFLSKKTKDLMLTLSHYCFRQRLIEKVHEYKGFRVYTVNEAYTSKTCTNCGNIYDIGTSKIYSCQRCGIVIDRDVNASRNIFLKYCCLT